MLPVIEDFTSNTATSSNSLALTKPSGVQVDELLLLFVGNDRANSNGTEFDTFVDDDDLTWNLAKNAGDSGCDCHCAIFWRHATGDEGTTLNVPSGSSQDFWGSYVRVSGARIIGTPVHKAGAIWTHTNTGTHVLPTLETFFADCLVFYIFAYDGGDTTALNVSGTGWTQGDFLRAGTGSGNGAGTWGYRTMAAVGDTGDATINPTINDGGTGFQLAIAREGAPPSEIKEGVLRVLDEVWSHRDDTEEYSSDPDDVVADGITYRVHGYARKDNDNANIRVKTKD